MKRAEKENSSAFTTKRRIWRVPGTGPEKRNPAIKRKLRVYMEHTVSMASGHGI